jgi:hypothetical protein
LAIVVVDVQARMISAKLFSLPLFLLLLLWMPFPLSCAAELNSSNSGASFCKETVDCLSRIRKMAPDTSRFWFGEQWKFNCASHQQNGHRKVGYFLVLQGDNK